MNSGDKIDADILREYINPEKIEKAPEDFTSILMTRIQEEARPLKAAGRLRNVSLVPVISTAVTILLIVATFLAPDSDDSFTLPLLQYSENIKISIPRIDISHIFSFNLPVWLSYLFLGILILTIFDRALYGLFRREK
jgi:hypothetical protein